MLEAVVPFFMVVGGIGLAIVGIRARVRRQINVALEYDYGDVETDELVENTDPSA